MKDIVSLRNHLFDALNRLAECHDTEDLGREVGKAASIVQVAETIIKTAEVENQFIAITKAIGSGFIPVVSNKPISLIGKIKEAAEQSEQKEDGDEKEEIFNVDKEDNWLSAEQGNVNHKRTEYDPLKK